MTSPYRGLPKDRFWNTGVAEQNPLSIKGFYQKKFEIGPRDRIATAGSCFAQHIAGHLRASGYSVLDLEPAPKGMEPSVGQRFGYGIYSARFGNIYLARQLLQLFQEADGGTPRDSIVWEKNGRFYDALRPGVEPDGLDTPEEVVAHRERHLKRVRRLFRTMDVFVFTFGLTEGWVHTPTGTVYPTCPGTIAGRFDPAVHAFKNFTFNEVYKDFARFRAAVRRVNPGIRFLVTVSPVPLKATAAGKHVLTATTYSKSVLRAVAGELYETYPDVDYFPSYEIITAPWARGLFFGPDQREVLPAGVANVMRVFSEQHPPTAAKAKAGRRGEERDKVICEEELLGAFQP